MPSFGNILSLKGDRVLGEVIRQFIFPSKQYLLHKYPIYRQGVPRRAHKAPSDCFFLAELLPTS